jgi:hypothetical protein
MKADGRRQTADGRRIQGLHKVALVLLVVPGCSCFLLLPPDAHAQLSQTQGNSPTSFKAFGKPLGALAS